MPNAPHHGLPVLPASIQVNMQVEAKRKSQTTKSVVIGHLPYAAGTRQALEALNGRTASCFAFRDPFIRGAMQALSNAAHAGWQLPDGYINRMTEAMLSHLSHWVIPSQRVRVSSAARRASIYSLQDILDYMAANLGEPLDLNHLAERAGVSKAKFTRDFRSATGMSAHQYLMDRRLEAAKELLATTQLGLAEIAYETGFSSQSHLTSAFRARSGMTPARFRADC